jgi:hypothetical protein
MRSAIALVAFAFFALNAATMSPDGWDNGIRPLFEMFRTVFIGLSILSLVAVDWNRIAGFLRDKVPTGSDAAAKAEMADKLGE